MSHYSHNQRPAMAARRARRARLLGVTATIGLLQLGVAAAAPRPDSGPDDRPAAAPSLESRQVTGDGLRPGMVSVPRGVSHGAMTAAMRAALASDDHRPAVDQKLLAGNGANGSNRSSTGFWAASSKGDDGRDGATGMQVTTIVSGGAIVTTQNGEAGVRVWSGGGGGGRGGDATASSAGPIAAGAKAVGGKGGAGGEGGAVTLTSAVTIVTSGEHAAAISVRSNGGDGGHGGSGDSHATAWGGLGISDSTGRGGDGGRGASGGAASVVNSGDILTQGYASDGILGESLGGFGSDGGAAGSGALSIAAIPIMQRHPHASSKGGAGSGGSVSLVNDGATIATRSDASHGVHGLSTGAGGGAGGAVSIVNSGEIYTDGDTSHGLFGQSVGGGMIAAGNSVPSLASAGGDGGDVELGDAGLIRTSGAESYGVVAQSVGGGITALSLPQDGQDAWIFGHREPRTGGGDGARGSGGAVTVNEGGAIETAGVAAAGVLAQSIGGGLYYYGAGGASGEDAPYHVGSRSGDGGKVEVNLSDGAHIATAGDYAHGVVAQSIGGGGYLGRADGSGARPANAGASGDGGAVVIASAGDARIFTRGAGANGVYAQSIGGGAWAGPLPGATGSSQPAPDTASGRGGAIDIAWRGSIYATGKDANAIFAQSGRQLNDGSIDPASGSGPVTIRLDNGQYVGGSGDGAAIRIDNSASAGAPNQIHIGEGAEVAALSDKAIVTHGADVTQIMVNGVLTGDVLLAPSPASGHERNSLRVEDHGVYRSAAAGGTVDLGAQDGGAWLDIAEGGTLDIGGKNNFSSLFVNGGLRLAGGDALVDVGVDPRTGERHNDVINVVNGIQIVSPADHQPSRIRVNVVDALLPGPYVIFNKTPEMDGALEAAGNAGSPISWSMRDGGRTIAPEARFLDAARGFQLGATESNMLDALQKAWNASTLSDAALFGAFAGVDSPEAYRKAVATLSPQGYLAAAAAQLERASSAMDAAMSCRDDDLSRGQDPAGCIWGRISSGRAWRDGVQPEQGTRRSDITYRFGVRTPLAPQWWVGVSGAYVTANTATPYGYLQSRGQGADMSVALGHDVGNWTFAAAASFGYGSHDATQHVAIGANNWNARSNQQTWTTGMRLHASYLMDLGVFRVRPFTNLDAIHVSSPGFTTTGDLPAAYRFDPLRQWTAQVNPGVEIGAQFQIADNVWLRPDVTVGADFAFGDRTLQTGVELGAGGARFTTVQALDPITLDASAGLSLLVNQNVELRTEYRTRVGESTRSHEAVGRLSVRF